MKIWVKVTKMQKTTGYCEEFILFDGTFIPIMKILVADKIAAEGVAFLKAQPGFEVIEAYGSSPAKILELAADVHAIIVRSETQVTADVIKAANNLIVVGRAGVGVDNINIDAATEKGVIVMNTPGGNTTATAELTFTHLLCSARPVAQACQTMHEGTWDRKRFGGNELSGKTLGILGLGRIGTEVAKRALAFNMKVLAYDPFLTSERAQALGVRKVEVDDIFTNADFITVHMPKTEQTDNLVNAAAFAKMKKGVRIVNCARGGLVNEDDLVEAIKSGKVAAAGLDVFVEEPLAADHPLRKLPNVVLTPHLGASTTEAQFSVGVEIAENVAEVLQGGMARGAINMPAVDPRTLKQLHPYLVLGQKLGTIAQQLQSKPMRKLRITFWGKLTEVDILPLTRAIQRGYLRRICSNSVNDVNAPLMFRNHGVEVEIVKSNTETDFNDLIRVESITADGGTVSVEGTVVGRTNKPRIVAINDRDVEVCPEHFLLVYTNLDVPGTVGRLGTLLGRAGVNIAAMSLSRVTIGGNALAVLQLDNAVPAPILREIAAMDAIQTVNLVEL